jgi:DNA-binding transcriptional MerR regulator
MKTADAAPIKLHIGKLAARTGRSVHAIRWYETQGLIPGVARDGGGRRVYTERHVGWLEFIDRLRLTGMSVAQMREYAALVTQGKTTLKRQQELLRSHRVRVKATIAEWTAALKLLDHKIEFYGEWLSTGQRPPKGPEVGRRRQR